MIDLRCGDALALMREMESGSVDAIVTDPPYGLEFMGKEWDKFRLDDPGTMRHRGDRAGAHGIAEHDSKRWGDGKTIPSSRTSFGGGKRAKTYRCVGCGKRDQFRNPHSCPPDTAWKSEIIDPHAAPPTMLAFHEWSRLWAIEAHRVAKPGAHLLAFGGTRTFHRLTCAIEDAGWEIRDCVMWMYGSGFPKSHNLHGEREGWGTALKPAWEPIIMARKPLAGTVADNVQRYGTGAINVDGCRVKWAGPEDAAAAAAAAAVGYRSAQSGGRVPSTTYGMDNTENVPAYDNGVIGRWPANVVHDGSEEVVERFPNVDGQFCSKPSDCAEDGSWGTMQGRRGPRGFDDSGSAARFFYCAKASRSERGEGNNHPTVKPVALMQWLCRLVTPPAGIVLDPFMGSGSTGIAADREGFSFIGLDLSPEYVEIARRRISADAPLFNEEAP